MLPTPGSSAFLRGKLLFDLIFVPFRSQKVPGTGLWADSATYVRHSFPVPGPLSVSGSSLSWPISPLLSKKPPVLFTSLFWTDPDPVWGFPGGSVVKNLPAIQEMWNTQIQSLGLEDPLEEIMATHSSILAGTPLDRGTWHATVQRVAKSWTWLTSWTHT